MKENLLKFYLNELKCEEKPEFLEKYLEAPSLKRLEKIGYFCGMDYASKNIYNFKEHITRFDHSLTVALLTWKCTKDKKATLAGLFHDISTPCFSHVIDYMNKDYKKQESTEEYTEDIIKKDKYLLKCLKEDNVNIDDIINFKKYSIVDNDRPKLCADRLDGVILTGIAWTKNIQYDDIKNIINDIHIYDNEIGFKTKEVADKVVSVSKSIDIYCHSKEDNYMMELLAKIAKYGIDKKYITYSELFTSTEENIINKLKNTYDKQLLDYFNEFENISQNEIPDIDLPDVKIRDLKPIANGKRI
jgi:HD superfamily phosphohydrolase